MGPTSSTLKATGGYGLLAALIMGMIATIWPEIAERVPVGFEGTLAVGIGVILGKFQKENVLRAQWNAELKAKTSRKKKRK